MDITCGFKSHVIRSADRPRELHKEDNGRSVFSMWYVRSAVAWLTPEYYADDASYRAFIDLLRVETNDYYNYLLVVGI